MVAPGAGFVLGPGENEIGIADARDLLLRLGALPDMVERLLTALEQLSRAGCVQAWMGGPMLSSGGADMSFRVVWDPHDVDPRLLDGVFFGYARDFSVQRERFGGAVHPANADRPGGQDLANLFGGDAGAPQPVLRIRLGQVRA